MAWILDIFLDQEGRLRGACKAVVFLVLCSLFAFLLRFPASVIQLFFNHEASSFDFRLGLLSTCLGALFVTWICCSIEGVPIRSVGFRFNRVWLRQCLVGCVLGALVMVGTALVLWGMGGVHWLWSPRVFLSGLPMGLPAFVLVAIHEELVFRGYAFQRLGSDLGRWPALAIMSVLFLLAHWGNPGMSGSMRLIASLNIGLAGFLLGFSVLRTGSLAMPIGLHFGWNWTQGSLLGFNVSGTGLAHGIWTPALAVKPAWVTGGGFGLEGSLLCAPICLAAILVLAFWKTPSEIG